jgi:hypothetical protein
MVYNPSIPVRNQYLLAQRPLPNVFSPHHHSTSIQTGAYVAPPSPRSPKLVKAPIRPVRTKLREA